MASFAKTIRTHLITALDFARLGRPARAAKRYIAGDIQTVATTKSGTVTISKADIRLTIDNADNGGHLYRSRQSVEERQNLLYANLRTTLNPDLVVDVGANYGFTAIVFSKHFPSAKIILIEPSPRLQRYIRGNLDDNGVDNYELANVICGESDASASQFGLNPNGSQDNRVHGLDGWDIVTLPMRTLRSILGAYVYRRVFVKIDTQGFETQIFRGALSLLESFDGWFAKCEFSPSLLRSQGNNPRELLELLVSRFRVVESPARTRFQRDTLDQLFANPLRASEIDEFIDHVISLDDLGLGWVDLYVAPRTTRSWLIPIDGAIRYEQCSAVPTRAEEKVSA